MTSSILVLISAAIIGFLGLAHLLFTYVKPRLLPRDPALIESMKQSTLKLTSETTLWKAWIGFNASHSIGALLFGSTFGYLAVQQPALFFSSLFLQGLGLATLVTFLVLAKLYWFRTPLAGISVSLLLYIAGISIA